MNHILVQCSDIIKTYSGIDISTCLKLGHVGCRYVLFVYRRNFYTWCKVTFQRDLFRLNFNFFLLRKCVRKMTLTLIVRPCGIVIVYFVYFKGL